MDGFRSPPPAPLKGIGLIGDSTLAVSYFAPSSKFIIGTGAADNYDSRPGQLLAASTGWRVINLAQDGAEAEDFLGLGAQVQKIPAAVVPAWWRAARCKYYVIKLGLNAPPHTDERIAKHRADVQRLVQDVLAFGATPILMTNTAVYWTGDLATSWYNTNRNLAIDDFDDQLRDIAAVRPDVLLCDYNAIVKNEHAEGRLDQRVRTDGTFDTTNDHLHVGAPAFADHRSDIHPNFIGCALMAQALADLITAEGLSET